MAALRLVNVSNEDISQFYFLTFMYLRSYTIIKSTFLVFQLGGMILITHLTCIKHIMTCWEPNIILTPHTFLIPYRERANLRASEKNYAILIGWKQWLNPIHPYYYDWQKLGHNDWLRGGKLRHSQNACGFWMKSLKRGTRRWVSLRESDTHVSRASKNNTFSKTRKTTVSSLDSMQIFNTLFLTLSETNA